ncbi:CBS domain-containing protein [Streptomyces sp. LN699]|uniref:CBS domain-containing protein n=1 Tax=Streptomyces sp. LN699 TaxID=3112981 RepID=UPI00371A0074
MTKARDIMTADATCIGANETVLEAAKKMAELKVGSLPIRGTDDKLKGRLTDRDIVVNVLAAGKDPATVKAVDLAQGEAVTIGADDDVLERTARKDRTEVAFVLPADTPPAWGEWRIHGLFWLPEEQDGMAHDRHPVLHGSLRVGSMT